MSTEGRQRGLPSLNEARAERRRALVAGKVRLKAMSPHFWLWTLVILGVFGVVYWKFAEGQLASQKSGVMAKQRAVARTLGPKIQPFVDRVEGWTKSFASLPWPGDHVAPGTTLEQIEKANGAYLRLRQANAKDEKSIRNAAVRSLHDGFVSCLFVRKGAPDPSKGEKCVASADCKPGLLCNEYDVCAPPQRPYNMRLAYRALRVLSSDWTDELHQATSDLAVTAYDRDLDRVTHDDVPIAIEMLSRAKYFTLVIDEDPVEGLPAGLDDAGTETDEQRVQRSQHFARVGIWDLESGTALLRVRTTAGGQAVPVGERSPKDPEILAAQQRQVNSCSIALAVKSKVVPAAEPDGATDAGVMSDAGVPSASDGGATP